MNDIIRCLYYQWCNFKSNMTELVRGYDETPFPIIGWWKDDQKNNSITPNDIRQFIGPYINE